MVRLTGQLRISAWSPISSGEVILCVKRIGNWKSLGSDQVYGFWVNLITCVQDDFTRNYNLLFQDPESVLNCLAQETITLIPKNDKNDQVKNYRPITCPSVVYKTPTQLSRQLEDCRAFDSRKRHGIGVEGLSAGFLWCKGSPVD